MGWGGGGDRGYTAVVVAYENLKKKGQDGNKKCYRER